jgi:uncharacterized repeat protein (TIGR03803 family)
MIRTKVIETLALAIVSVAAASTIAYGQTPVTLVNFDITNGDFPYFGSLVQATNGYLYGATYEGGANSYGTIFKITPGGVLTTLHSFDSTDGANASSGLIQATNGYLYGTTYQGGASSVCPDGCGTIFKITPAGVFTTVHSFDEKDGTYPYAALIQATNGLLYGSTTSGGSFGYGTIFQITPAGALTTLVSFNVLDGADPQASLLQATDGNFYGTTPSGGKSGNGTIFELTSAGVLTSLFSFDNTDGTAPFAALMEDTNGTLYGTTNLGGTTNDGTLFSFSVGLGPFVETRPASGAVGAAIKILGTGLTGATSVTFNGTAAAFTVVSGAEITTTVPTGATTGNVQVVTPHGTFVSNVAFRVP